MDDGRGAPGKMHPSRLSKQVVRVQNPSDIELVTTRKLSSCNL